MKTIATLTSIALISISCTKRESSETETNTATTATAEAAKPYPLDVCIVSGEKLGSMGEPITLIHEGQEIKFCCDECLPEFKENPEKYLSKLSEKSAD